MSISNNKTDNSGTALEVDDQTVEGVTTDVSDVVSLDDKKQDNVTTFATSKDLSTPNTPVDNPSLKPSVTESPSKLSMMAVVKYPANPYAKTTFAASKVFFCHTLRSTILP